MTKDFKILLAVGIVLGGVTAAIGGAGTINVLDGGGVSRTYDVVTDGSGNFVAKSVICDQAAAANCATVSASNALKIDGSGVTQPVSAASLPLPTGASTSALQTTGNTTLTTISTNTTGASFSTTFPSKGTAIGVSNGGNMIAWPAVTASSATNSDVVPEVAVANVTPLGRAVAASASPVVPVAAANTNGAIGNTGPTAVVVKSGAGTLFGVQLANIGSGPAYVKFYNATSATCGSGTPVKRLIIPAAPTAANGGGSNVAFGPGLAFSTGITYCVTTGITDGDATAPSASTVLVNVDYE